jgi:hypothetical protein
MVLNGNQVEEEQKHKGDGEHSASKALPHGIATVSGEHQDFS